MSLVMRWTLVSYQECQFFGGRDYFSTRAYIWFFGGRDYFYTRAYIWFFGGRDYFYTRAYIWFWYKFALLRRNAKLLWLPLCFATFMLINFWFFVKSCQPKLSKILKTKGKMCLLRYHLTVSRFNLSKSFHIDKAVFHFL